MNNNNVYINGYIRQQALWYQVQHFYIYGILVNYISFLVNNNYSKNHYHIKPIYTKIQNYQT